MKPIRNRRRNRWRVKKAKRELESWYDLIYGYSVIDEYCDPEEWESPAEAELNEALEECRLSTDGSCLLAGTEFCDWDCPLRNGAIKLEEAIA